MMKIRKGMPSEEEINLLKEYTGKWLHKKREDLNEKLLKYGLMIKPDWSYAYYTDRNDYLVFEGEEEEKKKELPLKGLESITAKMIKEHTDKYVVKQDRAKKILSAEISSHYKRILSKPNPGKVKQKKRNILLLGSTGVGKSYLVEKIAEMMKVPFARVDATSYTAAGYVGNDVEDIVRVNLLSSAKGNIKLAEKGIVYIDEFDKISASKGGHGPDVGGDKVQTALLTLIEGKEIEVVPSWKKRPDAAPNPSKSPEMINTKDILFIVGGSFSFGSDGSLVEIIRDRKKQKNEANIGFGAEVQNKDCSPEDYDFLKDVTPQDLMKFGMRPEIVGRFQAIVPLENLCKDDLVKILVKDADDSLVMQYKQEFQNLGINLKFEDEALYAIAEKAAALKTGARSLELIMFQTLFDYRYELEGTGYKELKVTRAMVENPSEDLNRILQGLKSAIKSVEDDTDSIIDQENPVAKKI